METEETILESFKRGEKQAKERGVIGAYWLEYFGFKGDPFSEELESVEFLEETFIDREEIIRELAEYIGGSKHIQNNYHICLIGPEGSGKTSILQMLNEHAEKYYETMLYNIKYDSVISTTRTVDLADPLRDEDLKCVFFDDCYTIDRLKIKIKARKEFPGVLITALNPVSSKEIIADRKIKLLPLNSDNIVQMLKKRVTLRGDHAVFSEEFYNTVAEISLGNPSKALSVAKEIAEELFNIRNDEEEVKILLQKNLVTFRNEKLRVTKQWQSLTTKEKKVLEILMELVTPSSITPKELKNMIEGGRALAWKYLERLADKNLLRKTYRGKSTIYHLIPGIKAQLDTLYMEDEL